MVFLGEIFMFYDPHQTGITLHFEEIVPNQNLENGGKTSQECESVPIPASQLTIRSLLQSWGRS